MSTRKLIAVFIFTIALPWPTVHAEQDIKPLSMSEFSGHEVDSAFQASWNESVIPE